MSQLEPDVLEGLGTAGARLIELEQQLVRTAERCQQVQHEVQTVRVSAQLNFGAGELTVDSAGVLTDLRLTMRSTNLRPEQLAAEIMRACGHAQARLGEQVEQAARRIAPEEAGLRERLVAIQQERFGEPDPPPRARSDGGDESGDSFLVR